MKEHLALALVIFLLTYIAIVSEKINRTSISLFGAILMIVFEVISQEQAFLFIDFNTIGLLIGMMIIVNILKRTGIFQFIAIKTAKIANGNPTKIMVLFCIITAISSALLDNVTTILLIAPVTFVITETLDINPISFLIPEVLAANIGGAATLIGDPPNIMIAGSSNLSFMDFLINLGPVIAIIFIISLLILKKIYKKSLVVKKENVKKLLNFDEKRSIQDKILLKKSFFVLALTMIGFTTHEILHLESATVALFGGIFLLLISKCEVEDILIEIEWTTIFFFCGLFILVGALEEVGVINFLAKKMIAITNGNLSLAKIVILWLSAIASSFLDNIPFVATMIPLINNIASMSHSNIEPLWWSLSLGACLGGNGTIVGASANVIVFGMLKKKGFNISFLDFMKIGFPIMLISIIISNVYLVLFYV